MKSIGIIGYGAFGSFLETLAKRFLPNIPIRIYSRTHAADGERFFSLEETCSSDAVVFAVPIAAFEVTVQAALPYIRNTSVLIDIATVKVHTVEILRRLAPNRPYIACHPMFGPESYKKLGNEVSGLRIVLCVHTLPVESYTSALAFLRTCGLVVVEMPAEKHDQLLAETLFLTHFVGQVVARAGFVRSEIDSASFGFLMEAVEIVKNDTVLFKDVYRFNPYCRNVLDRLETAEQETRALLEDE